MPQPAFDANMGEHPVELRRVGNVLFWSGNGKFEYGTEGFGPGPKVLLSPGAVESEIFGVDDVNIYWAASGAQLHIQPWNGSVGDAGTPTTIPEGNIAWIEADQNPMGYVYWFAKTESQIYRTAKTGNGSVDAISKVTTTVGRLLSFGPYLYWSDPPDTTCSGSVLVRRRRIDDLTTTVVETLASVSGCPLFARDANAVYWTDGAIINRQVVL
jgi:hypothetical protein